MTTLVMVQKEDDVILGWDSLMVRGNERINLVAPKMWVQDGIIYALAGMLRASDVMEGTTFPDYDGSDPRLWIIREWVPAFKAALMEHEVTLLDQEDGGVNNFGLLMVVGGQAFGLDSMLSPAQSDRGIYTMGSGGDYARGILYAHGTVLEALEAAAEIDPGTGGDLTAKSANALLAESFQDDGKYRVRIERVGNPSKAWGFVLDTSKVEDLETLSPALGEVLVASLILDREYLKKHVG